MTYKLIEEIASDNSKLHKEAVIRREALAGNKDFFAGLRYALDNIDTFGVKKVPELYDAPGKGLSFAEFKDLADKLIKRELTGGAATQAISDVMWKATRDEWNGWYRLILLKDFKAGFSESTVNKAVKDVNAAYVVPTTPYMRCSLPAKSNMEEWDWSKGIYSETKADGMFANVNVSEDSYVWVTSRGGTLFPAGVLGIEDELAATLDKGTQTHGELTIYIDGVLQAREIGNGIFNSLLKGGTLEANQKVVYDCWDQIPLSVALPKGKYAVTYDVRFDNIKRQIVKAHNDAVKNGTKTSVHMTETRVVYSMAEAIVHYKEHRARKLEGTILKTPELIWKDGTSKDQVKMKEEIDVELKVIGFNPGKGKNADTFGSIQCQSECGLLEANFSGFEDDMRKAIWADRINWPGKIITGRSNSLLAPSKGKKNGMWSLFLPRFIEERMDKTVADTLEQIQAIFKAAEAAAAPEEETEE
jgi:DNA ligase-1